MIRFSKLKHGDDLLNLLATSDKFVPVNNLMEGLDLSRRSVFYLIKKLNQELDENGHFNITNVKEVGYYLPTETITALQSEPKQERFSGLLPIERKQLILFKLINRPYSSLSYLSNYLTVSKNTIIRDFSVVENELKSNHLKLINTNSGKKSYWYGTRQTPMGL
ncbi:hypothetical protein [Secundilactobacillus silagei]|uniref:hypothetical protein n=1 Tax=Secundilactobacillus silagei TaxID=1293415 RepID=UPI0006D174CE|nr:hypothetical protein [Secundilactobacillus silagei]